MKLAPLVLLVAATGIAAHAASNTRIKIDTVPDRYTPSNATFSKPVSMSGFHFEVNPVRARVVVDYTYADEPVYSQDDDNHGPQSTYAQLPGLKYDASAHTVVYEAEGNSTVCANVEEHKGLFGKHLKLRNTGACFVTADNSRHAEDNGWSIDRFQAIDTYFVVR